MAGLLLLVAPVGTSSQTIYSWTDLSGRVVYSQFRPEIKTTNLRVIEQPSARAARNGERANSLKPGSGVVNVVIESTADELGGLSVVRVPLAGEGVYAVAGRINYKAVTCMIDTGASLVTINRATALRLGLNLKRGERTQVTTASGVVGATRIVFDTIQIGGLRVTDVDGVVLDGLYPKDALLGMSFLRQISMSQQGGDLLLTRLP